VLLALFGTCDPEAQIVMSSATSSADAMSRLTKVYANQSRTRIMSLKKHLSSITKGDSNVCDYLHSIRSVVDELALIGHSVIYCLLFTYHISKLIFTYIHANITAYLIPSSCITKFH